MNKTILEFCNEININPKLRSEITNKILEHCKNNDTSQSKINIINEIILPEAAKLGFSFSAKELIEHEENVKNELTSEDLESISGGAWGIKTKAISLFAALSLSSAILAQTTSFAIDPPISASTTTTSKPNSTIQNIDVDLQILNTSSSTAQSENENKPDSTSSNALNLIITNPDASNKNVIENQTMSKEETIKAVIENIMEELKNSDVSFETEVTEDELHNTNEADKLSKLIKNFNEKSKNIANIMDQKSSFQSLEKLISSGGNKIFDEIFGSLQKCSLSPREKAAAMLILDDWANLKGFGHNTSVTASPYFMNEEGKVLWPDNNGYKKDSKIKDVIGEMNMGYKIDRYGSEYGFYVCSANNSTGVSYAKRALANRENKNLYHKYSVTRAFSELETVIAELGLTECLKLENDAVNAYKEVKDQIKTDFQIKPNANPYSKQDNFNYKQLQSLIQNKDSIDNMLIENAGKDKVDKVKKKFDELGEILSKYTQVFETAKQNNPDKRSKIQILQKNIECCGYINLTDNLKNSKANSGPIAPAFKQEGGGEQIELPCSVGVLKALGFLQDAKD